jgi:translation initiation factor 1 (eIF-1/SUI1)
LHNALTGGDFSTDNKGNFKVPCSTTTSFAFVFADTEFEVHPINYMTQQKREGNCSTMIQGIDNNVIDGKTIAWSLGVPFLTNVSVYYPNSGVRAKIS